MKIVTAAQIGLHFVDVGFGALGPELYVTGHHTAGPKDRDLAHAISLARQFHGQHKAQGWGGIGYHYMLPRSGGIICMRPTVMKGAHVGGFNSNNIGITANGTTGDKPTLKQKAALRWLLRYAHTEKMPKAHRTDKPLRLAKRRGHNDWPGHTSNACPATHKPMYLNGGSK